MIVQCLGYSQSSKLDVLSVLMAQLEPLEVARVPLIPDTSHMHTRPPFFFSSSLCHYRWPVVPDPVEGDLI